MQIRYHPLALGAQWLYVFGCWLILLKFEVADQLVPRGLPFLSGLRKRQVLSKLILPETTQQAFTLGQIVARVEAGLIDRTAGTAQAAEVLKIDLSDLPDTWLDELNARLQEQATPTSALAIVLGIFSLANVLWCIAIAGFAVSFGPAAYVLFKPAVTYIVRVLHQLWDHVLHPMYPLVLAYILFAIAVVAKRYPSDMAPFIALTSLAGDILLANIAHAFRSVDEHNQPLQSYWDHNSNVYMLNMTSYWGVLTLASGALALACHSQLIGFLSASALFSALGFGVWPYGLCWAIGWQSWDAMMCTAGASATLLALLFLARSIGVEPEWTAPFRLGIATFGSIGLFLAGLIRSSTPWVWEYREYNEPYKPLSEAELAVQHARVMRRHMATNVLYVGLLFATICGGTVLGLKAARNTALTFAVFYASEKTVETMPRGMFWPLFCLGSGALWWISFFLKAHPEWLGSLFDI